MKLLSTEFLALALAAAVLLPALRGWARWGIFFALNVVFASSYLYDPQQETVLRAIAGILSTATLCVAGYWFARWAQSSKKGVVVGIATISAGFVYLRHYTMLDYVLPTDWTTNLLVTAGLSFLFFKIIHVIVDARSDTIGRLHFGTYLNYCLNFTTFLMGPIQRYQDYADQWNGRTESLGPGFEAHLDATNRILRGLVKKFVIAEMIRRFSIHSDPNVDTYESIQLLLRVYVFYLYLYCDFSGYCDIMIGTGSLMGVRPPENFHLPFFSRNVTEYWLRVHKSLTLWLTDYVFNPCYAMLLRTKSFGSRAFLSLALSLIVTMFVSGLWHGTTINFLLFGLVHGVFLVATRGYEHLMKKALGKKRFRAWTKHPAVHLAAIVMTYNVTSLAYVFFVMDATKVLEVVRRILSL